MGTTTIRWVITGRTDDTWYRTIVKPAKEYTYPSKKEATDAMNLLSPEVLRGLGYADVDLLAVVPVECSVETGLPVRTAFGILDVIAGIYEDMHFI